MNARMETIITIEGSASWRRWWYCFRETWHEVLKRANPLDGSLESNIGSVLGSDCPALPDHWCLGDKPLRLGCLCSAAMGIPKRSTK